MAMAPAHPLAQADRINRSDLATQQYIFYDQNSETYRLVDRYFSEAKVQLQAALHMGSMAAIKEMAKIGMEGFQQFMVQPDQIDGILDRLEKARERVYQ